MEKGQQQKKEKNIFQTLKMLLHFVIFFFFYSFERALYVKKSKMLVFCMCVKVRHLSHEKEKKTHIGLILLFFLYFLFTCSGNEKRSEKCNEAIALEIFLLTCFARTVMYADDDAMRNGRMFGASKRMQDEMRS